MARTKEFDREAVLDKAMRLFWRQGYEATSLHELTEAMGIGRQSLYDTFGDKHALYLAALDRYCATVGEPLFAPLAEPGPVKLAIRRVFERAIEGSVDEGRHGCLMANAIAELAPRDRDVACRAEANLTGAEEAFRRALERGQAAGEVAAHHDARTLARYLFNALQGLRLTAKTTPDRRVLTEIVDVTLSVLD
jgi:TetR/AcrR family transcriptional regulator, transcriptional repressor for nem operon